jgi:muramidase (phage lysozyme)
MLHPAAVDGHGGPNFLLSSNSPSADLGCAVSLLLTSPPDHPVTSDTSCPASFVALVSVLSSAFIVLTILQRSRAVVFAAGLGLSFATPALAAETFTVWTGVPPSSIRQVATLPQLPPAPRFFAITPERRAMLNTIRYAEGTWVNGDASGYRMLFGGSYVGSLDRHPDRVMYSPRYASAAAGAYQFMPFTWSMVSRSLGLRDFEPDSQDQGALYLIQRRGGLHLVDRGELTPELAARLSPEWASFPTLAGHSYYGQPVKRFDDLRRFYQDNLSQLRQGGQPRWEEVPIRQIQSRCSVTDPDCRVRVASVPSAPSGSD